MCYLVLLLFHQIVPHLNQNVANLILFRQRSSTVIQSLGNIEATIYLFVCLRYSLWPQFNSIIP